MAFGFSPMMSATRSRMGSMGMGNRPGDAPSLGGRFGGTGQAPPSGGRFGIGPSRPPMMPPQSQGNAYGRMKPRPMPNRGMNPGSSRRIVRPPITGYTPPPMPEQPMNEQGMGPRPDFLQMLMGGMGPVRRML